MKPTRLLFAFLLPLPLLALSGSSPPPREAITVSGRIATWELDMDGTLLFELRHPPTGKRVRDASTREVSTWFRTPPVRSEERHVQQMVLALLLAQHRDADFGPLTVTGSRERALDGRGPEEALPVESIRAGGP